MRGDGEAKRRPLSAEIAPECGHVGAVGKLLYDEPWLGNATKTLDPRTRQPDLAAAGSRAILSRLAPLLKPAFQLAWAQDVRSMNSFLADEPDVAQHLFGADRVSLARPAEVLAKAYGLQCFYCSSRLQGDRQVDHVLPWSRVGLDGLADLVLACLKLQFGQVELRSRAWARGAGNGAGT